MSCPRKVNSQVSMKRLTTIKSVSFKCSESLKKSWMDQVTLLFSDLGSDTGRYCPYPLTHLLERWSFFYVRPLWFVYTESNDSTILRPSVSPVKKSMDEIKGTPNWSNQDFVNGSINWMSGPYRPFLYERWRNSESIRLSFLCIWFLFSFLILVFIRLFVHV